MIEKIKNKICFLDLHQNEAKVSDNELQNEKMSTKKEPVKLQTKS